MASVTASVTTIAGKAVNCFNLNYFDRLTSVINISIFGGQRLLGLVCTCVLHRYEGFDSKEFGTVSWPTQQFAPEPLKNAISPSPRSRIKIDQIFLKVHTARNQE